MKIFQYMKPELIIPDLKAQGKEGALREFARTIALHCPGSTPEELFQVLTERERLGSTGIGEGFAIPHGKLKKISRIIIAFGRSRAGIPFDSMDGKPAHYFFILLAPEDSAGLHLKALAKISRFLKNSAFKDNLAKAAGRVEIERIIQEQDDAL